MERLQVLDHYNPIYAQSGYEKEKRQIIGRTNLKFDEITKETTSRGRGGSHDKSEIETVPIEDGVIESSWRQPLQHRIESMAEIKFLATTNHAL